MAIISLGGHYEKYVCMAYHVKYQKMLRSFSVLLHVTEPQSVQLSVT